MAMAAGGCALIPAAAANQEPGAWRDRFEVNRADLLPTGSNPYITMQPGRVLTLKHGADTLTITVLAESRIGRSAAAPFKFVCGSRICQHIRPDWSACHDAQFSNGLEPSESGAAAWLGLGSL
jgi:hypothetical protein